MGSVSLSIFTSSSGPRPIYIPTHNELCWNTYRS
ncbi:hypothetical protein Goshw_006210 [Gossypium schwendimanii]|uniref:Uncharacterized protein n=1 Tax=Gossypium schwendimanii TaxID=34291 RepID=A0A7J9LL48_GOSSC|nr:hypothetical protein [Gossypium schwendimanii]